MLFSPRKKPNVAQQVKNFLWPKKGLQRAWRYLGHRVKRISESPHVIALGFAAGAFASFTPFVGFHFILAAIIALIVRGNVLASALGTAVGNPLTFPFIWLATYNLGGLLLGYEHRSDIDISLPDGIFMKLFSDPGEFFSQFADAVGPVFIPMLAGSLPLGLGIALICYFPVKHAARGYQARRRAQCNPARTPAGREQP